ncbi:MAG: DegV family protein [Lactobacillus sp.]|nr:DegV family protein [Lactobacillus sp.]MCH4069161.1 DegV family protein [Lactobacillus sp.]MCI1329639.1 DegV family protein [Lactobacillus sp.]MCI1359881.1 DegV family protein [Lactobacillus sp.]MCI1399239.1 DegV family protein [Lactobacillus sp.]
MKIAVITDSTCGLSSADQEKYQIQVIATPIEIAGQSFLDGVNITTKQFFEIQKETGGFPHTSQPRLGDVIATCKKLHENGYDAIIAIALSSGISCWFNTLNSVKQEHPEFNLYPYDSGMTVKMQGNLAIAAAKMAANDLAPAEIIERLDQLRATIDELFIVDDLNNLQKNGRLSNASAFIGSLLHIKPLLTFEDGKIVAFDKVRSMKRALAKVEELAQERIAKLPYKDKLCFLVIHSNDLKQAEKMQHDVKQLFPGQAVEFTEFTPSIATHLGEKSMGFAWMYDINKFDLER